MKKLVIVLLGIIFVYGCAVAQSSKIEIEMVFVEGETFMMGCTSEQRADCLDSEKPAHPVNLNDFYIGKYEVTQAQWREIMGTDIRQQSDKVGEGWMIFGEGDNYPMYYVSWNEAQEFIKKLNDKTGKNYRLPTEAEMGVCSAWWKTWHRI